jgi:hypothetical protein
MNKIIIAVAAIAFLGAGYFGGVAQGAGDSDLAPAKAAADKGLPQVGAGDLVFDPLTPDPSALPELGDLPYPANVKRHAPARRYTGIIKNKTQYEVSIPSENSDATLVIPPHSWIEYTMWTRNAQVTAYHNGKPFYCLSLYANPREYPFMCSKYDFMAEIVKPEPTHRYKPMKKRKWRAKKQPNC